MRCDLERLRQASRRSGLGDLLVAGSGDLAHQQLRFNKPGRNGVCADAVGSEFACHGFGHGAHGALGTGIVRTAEHTTSAQGGYRTHAHATRWHVQRSWADGHRFPARDFPEWYCSFKEM